jgi:hypothetical protein
VTVRTQQISTHPRGQGRTRDERGTQSFPGAPDSAMLPCSRESGTRAAFIWPAVESLCSVLVRQTAGRALVRAAAGLVPAVKLAVGPGFRRRVGRRHGQRAHDRIRVARVAPPGTRTCCESPPFGGSLQVSDALLSEDGVELGVHW